MKKSIIAVLLFIILVTSLLIISRGCINRMNQSYAQKAGDLLLKDVYIEYENTRYKVKGYVKNQRLSLFEAIAAMKSNYISFDGLIELSSSSVEKSDTLPFHFTFNKKDGNYRINQILYRSGDWIFELFYEFSIKIACAYGDSRPLIFETNYDEVEFDSLGYPVGAGTINYEIKCVGATYNCTIEISSSQPDILLNIQRNG